MTDEDQPPSEYEIEHEPTVLVFFNNLETVECPPDELHMHTVRDDYAFALDMSGLPEQVIALCDEYELSPRVFGEVIEDAFMRSAVATGTAATMTLATQRYLDEGIDHGRTTSP